MNHKPLSAELEAFRQSYADLFGEVPPLPQAKFEFAGDLDQAGLAQLEALRANAFYGPELDHKTTQLICFAILLTHGHPAAAEHAKAARRLGASWEELWAVCKIGSAVMALGPANLGGSMLGALRAHEEAGSG